MGKVEGRILQISEVVICRISAALSVVGQLFFIHFCPLSKIHGKKLIFFHHFDKLLIQSFQRSSCTALINLDSKGIKSEKCKFGLKRSGFGFGPKRKGNVLMNINNQFSQSKRIYLNNTLKTDIYFIL